MTPKKRYRIRNWKKFQHYSNRRPSWIKFYGGDLVHDRAWMSLSNAQRGTLALAWALASERNGECPSPRAIEARLEAETESKPESISFDGLLGQWIEEFNPADEPASAGAIKNAMPEEEVEETRGRGKKENGSMNQGHAVEVVGVEHPRHGLPLNSTSPPINPTTLGIQFLPRKYNQRDLATAIAKMVVVRARVSPGIDIEREAVSLVAEVSLTPSGAQIIGLDFRRVDDGWCKVSTEKAFKLAKEEYGVDLATVGDRA